MKGAWGGGLAALPKSVRAVGDTLERQFLDGYARSRRAEMEQLAEDVRHVWTINTPLERAPSRPIDQPPTEEEKLEWMNMFARGLESGLNGRGGIMGAAARVQDQERLRREQLRRAYEGPEKR